MAINTTIRSKRELLCQVAAISAPSTLMKQMEKSDRAVMYGQSLLTLVFSFHPFCRHR